MGGRQRRTGFVPAAYRRYNGGRCGPRDGLRVVPAAGAGLVLRMALSAAQENDTVLLIAGDGRRYFFRLRAGDRFHTHKGVIAHDDLIGQPLGRQIRSHLNFPFVVLRPSIFDLLMNLKRVSQIIYPKEIGPILLRLDVTSGRRIIEAGTGSGALTMALAYGVQLHGKVYSYEAREDMINVARKNLAVAGLLEYVQLKQRDIAEGFDETDVDALFLDVREPWDYLEQVLAALRDGGFFGALVPTTNQVSWLLAAMERHPFSSIEVLETLERRYKPVPARLRPQDVMVGHTGYLVFARKIAMLAADPTVEEALDDASDDAPPNLDVPPEDGR